MRTWIALIALVLVTSTVFAQPAAGKRDLSGTVADADGNPVANATLTVEGGATTTTGPDGAFKLSVAPANLSIAALSPFRV